LGDGGADGIALGDTGGDALDVDGLAAGTCGCGCGCESDVSVSSAAVSTEDAGA